MKKYWKLWNVISDVVNLLVVIPLVVLAIVYAGTGVEVYYLIGLVSFIIGEFVGSGLVALGICFKDMEVKEEEEEGDEDDK